MARCTSCIGFGFCLLLWVSTAGAQNLLSDPSFELGAVPDCGNTNLPLGWVSIEQSPDVQSFDCNVLPGWEPQHPIPSAQDGLRIVGAGALGSLVEAFGQVLDASLTSGQTYNLTGYFTSLVGTGEFDVFVSSGDPVDDAIVVGSIGGSAVEGSWTFDALEFVSPVDATFFGFRVRLISGGFLYLSCDDLDLTRSDPVPVFDESWGRIKSHFGPNAQ